MGDFDVKAVQSQEEAQEFMRFLLRDVQALYKMLKDDWFEKDPIRIGAEQEMCLVDRYWRPTHVNLQALDIIDNPLFTSELANFNLEANLNPLEFKGKALSIMHQELKNTLDKAQEKLNTLGANILLSGILPTIRKFDVEIANITPIHRYKALMDALKDLRGEAFELRISGVDELNIRQETAMLEACNTSFQVHLQVTPHDFVNKYNVAQALAGPVMAISVNSPLLFGRRLWKETRIALFQQSIDIRTFTEHLRDRSPRVTFGSDWLKKSIIEIYQEDIARFKILLNTNVEENVLDMVNNGITPKLRALKIHNSTVYRWNRPCYGISPNKQPHLRIENRILPSGPSLPDTMANAAFWLGLMNGMEDEVKDITNCMEFSDAKSNFFAAARFGLDTKLTWLNQQKVPPSQLIREQLLPIARHGLAKAGIDKEDISYYLDIIDARNDSGCTGSQWMLNSFGKLAKDGHTRDEISSAITSTIFENQHKGIPVHEWEVACIDKMHDYEPSSLLVEEFMSTDLITVQEDDILDLALNLMVWRKLRHIPVEDKHGKLVGLVTASNLLRYFSEHPSEQENGNSPIVKNQMIPLPKTISPDANIITVVNMMEKERISCLPVLKGEKLVGMITEADFLAVTRNLIKRLARRKSNSQNSVIMK